jgi:hypothetical protein
MNITIKEENIRLLIYVFKGLKKSTDRLDEIIGEIIESGELTAFDYDFMDSEDDEGLVATTGDIKEFLALLTKILNHSTEEPS